MQHNLEHLKTTLLPQQMQENDYTTSSDPRGYLPCFEVLSSNRNPLMWDREDGYVNWYTMLTFWARKVSKI